MSNFSRKTNKFLSVLLIAVMVFSIFNFLTFSHANAAEIMNVSLQKTITGFSSQLNDSDFAAKNLNDGVFAFYNQGWCSASGTGARNEWVTIDLGMPCDLEYMVITNEYTYDNRNVKDYVLYGSNTGAFAGEEQAISTGTLQQLQHLQAQTIDFTNCTYRYVKFKGTSSYSDYVVLGELEIYGKPATVQLPTPVIDYTTNKTFNGSSDFVDKNIDIASVASLAQGSVCVTFKTNSPDAAKTLFSVSDKRDPSSNMTIALNNGKIHYENRDNGSVEGTTFNTNITTTTTYNDNNWHTLVLTVAATGTKIYVDGVEVISSTSTAFFSSVLDINSMDIGRNVDKKGGEWFYQGEIYSVKVYNAVLDVTQVTELCKVSKPQAAQPIVNYDINQSFNGTTTSIDKSLDISKVSTFSSGSIFVNFKSKNNEVAKTLFSVSDKRDAQSNMSITLNNGKIHFENREAGKVSTDMTSTASFSDNNWHTLVLTVGGTGTRIYVDGVEVLNNASKAFFASVLDINSMEIGRNVNSAGGQWYYNGEIGNIKIYNEVLAMSQIVDLKNTLTPPPSAPIVNYNIKQVFNGTSDYIDKIIDAPSVAGLTKGSIFISFKSTNNEVAKALFSASDKRDASSNMTIALNSGKIYFENREGGTVATSITSAATYNDNIWHTLVLTVGDAGTKVYVDGKEIMSAASTAFFSNVKDINAMNIGRNEHISGAEWFYQGEIGYVKIYDRILTSKEIITIIPEPINEWRVIDGNDRAITYSGTWQHKANSLGYNGTWSFSNTTNSTAELSFVGTQIKWLGFLQNNLGKADIYIDNVLDKTVDCYFGLQLSNQEMYTKTGLAYGVHTIKIVVTGTRNASSANNDIVIDGFKYFAGDQAPEQPQRPSLTMTAGYVDNDTNPLTGVVGNWGYTSPLAFDTANRSIALDFGIPQSVNKIEICDSDSTSRLTPEDSRLYYSNDNITYTEALGFTLDHKLVDGRIVSSFELSGITARYIKVKTIFTDTNSTFLFNNIQNSIKAYKNPVKEYKLPALVGYKASDTTPETGAITTWNYFTTPALELDKNFSSVVLDLKNKVPVNAVEIKDSDLSSSALTNNFTVYSSNDNVNYIPVTGLVTSVGAVDNRQVFRFDFSNIEARFIKIHLDLNEVQSSFILTSINADVTAFSNNEAKSASFLVDPVRSSSRTSEGDIIPLKNGNLLFAMVNFEANASDESASDIIGMTSSDGGYSWSTEFNLITKVGEGAGINVMEPSLIRMKDGQLAIFYLIKNSTSDCKMYMKKLLNEEQPVQNWTWSNKVCVTPSPNGYNVVNNARVIRLSTGRLLVPVAFNAPLTSVYSAYCVGFYSDDDGQTWTRSTNTAPLGDGAWEPGLVELKNGNVFMYIRCGRGGAIYQTTSTNGGTTWSAVTSMGLTSPTAPATMARIPATGDLVMLWNNSLTTRTPLAAAISKDDGITWTNIKNLETYPYTTLYEGFGYTSCTFVGRKVILSYYKSMSHFHEKLRILDIDWFYN